MKSKLFSKVMKIRFQDCDPAGIVYYPSFLDKVEAVVEDWIIEGLGEDYRNWIFGERRGFPRVKVVCDFIKPCTMDDPLEIVIRLNKFGRSSIDLAVEGRVHDETRLKVNLVLVHMSLDSRKSVPLPEGFRVKLAHYQTLGAAVA